MSDLFGFDLFVFRVKQFKDLCSQAALAAADVCYADARSRRHGALPKPSRAAGLRQALQDAGLSTDSNSLSFNLRSEGNKFEQQLAEQGHAQKHDGKGTTNEKDGDELDPTGAEIIAAESAAADGRVNVQV